MRQYVSNMTNSAFCGAFFPHRKVPKSSIFSIVFIEIAINLISFFHRMTKRLAVHSIFSFNIQMEV